MTEKLKETLQRGRIAYLKDKIGVYWAALWFAISKGEFLPIMNATNNFAHAVFNTGANSCAGYVS